MSQLRVNDVVTLYKGTTRFRVLGHSPEGVMVTPVPVTGPRLLLKRPKMSRTPLVLNHVQQQRVTVVGVWVEPD